MKDWKDFLKKYFKQAVVLLLAVSIVVSYSLHRSSDSTLRAGGFPEEDQVDVNLDAGLGEDLSETGATTAAPVDLVLDDLPEDGAQAEEEHPEVNAAGQEESVSSPASLSEEGDVSPAVSDSEEGSASPEESPAESSGEEDGSEAGDSLASSETDRAEGSGSSDRTGSAADSDAADSGAEDDADEHAGGIGNADREDGADGEEGSRETFFTTEEDESENGPVSTENKAGEDSSGTDEDGQEKTFFTTEDDVEDGSAAGTQAGEEGLPKGTADTLVFRGPDYTVTASYGEDAGIPAGASLAVFEITEEAKDYQTYRDQARTALEESLTDASGQSAAGESNAAPAEQADTDTEVTVSWVRLFDITIEVDGRAVEPQGPVSVQIDYGEAIEQTVNEEVSTVHFEGEDEVPVVLETQTEGSGEALEQVHFETEGFSVFAVMGTTITKKILASDGVGYQITLTCGADAAIPADAELEVREIPADSGVYQACREKSGELFGADQQVAFARFFDITILKDGREIQPAAPVEVRIELADELQDGARAVHFEQESGGAPVQEAEDVEKTEAVLLDTSLVEADRMDSAVTFSATGFSIYGIIYTVDFHWDVNGKDYEYSIPGGGFISLADLFEALGIGQNDASENGQMDQMDPAQNSEAAPDNAREEGSDQGRDALFAENAGAGMENASVRGLVNVVERAVFSNPDLVWIGKVSTTSTVGDLIKKNDLEVQYSSDLTEEEIEKINAVTVQAGDWALISLFPFTSEESLTVFLKNGDQFAIRVTDAQISTHVITADGEDFIITVNYEDDAKIPEGAVLEAEEIVPETGEYEDYLARAMDAIREEDPGENKVFFLEDPGESSGTEAETAPDPSESNASESKPAESKPTESNASESAEADLPAAVGEKAEEAVGIRFARFFDIRITADGKTIEPAAPVQVTIAYADALDIEEDQTLCAVHFAESGTEVLQASPNEEQKAVTFMQDSFSVTGTIVTSGGGWPASGSSFVMYLKSGNNYYAAAHDGSLHQVSVNGSSLTFPDDAENFDIDQYLWTHEQQGSYSWTYHYVYYTDSQGGKHYLSPSSSAGISSSAAALSRDSSGRIYSGSSAYIGISSNSLAGKQSSGKGAAIQFASNFVLPRKVTIHFVDRDGNALTGVSYTGPAGYPVTANEDGTFTIPFQWGTGNSTATLQLDTDFSRSGYTYASTHLAGTREGKNLTYDGLTMDAALTERSNALYYYADAGQTAAYGSLTERNLNDALSVPNAAGTGMTNYVTSNTNKDIYVIMDPVPSYSPVQSSGGLDAEDPEFNKTLEDNGDGTYTLSLNVTGHGINASTNPKANVIFVVDTSSSMDKTDGTGTGYSRLHDTKPALKTLAKDLLLSNSMTGKDSDTVEVSMVSFDGGVVDEIGWTTDYNAFANQVDKGLALHRGTDWEDALDRAYTLGLSKQAQEPDQKVFVVFFTDGEASQYTSFHGQGTYKTTVNPNYAYWYSYFLCRESAKDEARAIVNAGMQFYAIYAFNEDSSKYKGEAGSDLLRNLVRHAYNSEELGNKNFFAKASNTAELEAAFNSILLSVREFLGFSDVVLNDDITSLTSTGINLVSSAVGGFSYSRSGGQYGSSTAWEDAPMATHTDAEDGDAASVQWDLGSMVLEEGVTYTVSFRVWPSQEAYDWLANLQNGTRTWEDVVEAGLDAPDGTNPQIVKNGDSYALLTNRPSLDSDEKIIHNKITYQKKHSQTVTEEDIPAGTKPGTPVEGRDDDGNRTITTYTLDNGVYTKTVVTEKETCFKNPDPMPLVPERMSVLKAWETSMNTSHPADELKFRVLVDGNYYQNDGSLAAGGEGTANAKVLPVSEETDWINSIHIAPGIVKYYDDDGNALSEALVLETGHNYSLEEYDLQEDEKPFLYYTSYEFHSQTLRPMIVDGTLQYLVLIDAYNPGPEGAQTYTIGTQTYYAAAGGSGGGTLTGTNYRTAELDVTKILENSSGADLTEEELDAETFTYRITLSIPDGTDPAGIVGYEYIPRTQDDAYTLFGYQEGETAFAADIERFHDKTFRAWNTLVYRDLVEWENIDGRIVSKTDADGNILWKVAKDGDGFHSITYDMTLNRNEVIRFTNLPTGTKYTIREIYANYYSADNSGDSAGHAPIDKACNLSGEGYTISQVLTTNGTVSKTSVENDTVSGTIDSPNVRYYNQFTNDRTSVTTQIFILKTNQDGSKPLPGAVFDLFAQEGYEAAPQTALQTGLTSSDQAGKEGIIDLGRLTDGTYYLVETAAPEGYIALKEPVVITVERGSVHYSMENSSLDDSGHGVSGDFQTGYQLRVTNDAGYALPSTGGPGASPLLHAGAALTALLIILAAALL